MKTMMYESQCARKGCENKVYVYAKDRLGTLPKAYCSKQHEGDDNYEGKFKKL